VDALLLFVLGGSLAGGMLACVDEGKYRLVRLE
jgi:hypothetical protein